MSCGLTVPHWTGQAVLIFEWIHTIGTDCGYQKCQLPEKRCMLGSPLADSGCFKTYGSKKGGEQATVPRVGSPSPRTSPSEWGPYGWWFGVLWDKRVSSCLEILWQITEPISQRCQDKASLLSAVGGCKELACLCNCHSRICCGRWCHFSPTPEWHPKPTFGLNLLKYYLRWLKARFMFLPLSGLRTWCIDY